MDIVTFLIIAGIIHGALFFLDTIFRSCSHYPYFLLLENTGLEIKMFSLKWYCTALNRTLIKWTMDRRTFLRLWFNAGVWVSIILLPVATFMIISMTINMLSSTPRGQHDKSAWTLEPMIPGVHVPLSDIKYHIVTLGLCSIFHELGHACAACREDVQLYGVGLVFAYIIPVAYVSLNADQLKLLSIQNQLRILCAGVWHNIVLAAFAALIFSIKSWLWLPFFISNSGVYVKSINANSPLYSANGLATQDVIYKINNCPIYNSNDWHYCILQSIKESTNGYCLTQSTIEEHDESIPSWSMDNGAVNCCDSSSLSRGYICFEYIEESLLKSSQLPSHSCLPARAMIEFSQQQCRSMLPCTTHANTHCMKPAVDNTTKIVRLLRKNSKDVLFFGHPADIYSTVEISNWIPKCRLLTINIPESMELLCKYVTVLSAGLAVLNIIPCFFFDGQHIVMSLIQCFLRPSIPSKSMRHIIALAVTSLGSLLLVVNLIYTILKN